MDAKTFNPEILYVFDAEGAGPNRTKNHSHDFFEMSIILEGVSHYYIDGKKHVLPSGSILLFNPGVEHHEELPHDMTNRQMHIGLRHFSLERYPTNIIPFQTPIIQLTDEWDAFLQICQAIIRERHDTKSGYELVMKSLIVQLLVLILRDSNTDGIVDHSLFFGEEVSERQRLVMAFKFYIENHYQEDLSLNQIAHDLYTSPATISRAFKEHLNETPINYLIRYRLEKAKAMMAYDQAMSVKDVALQIGYEDAFYFSKLFKKYYGVSPSQLLNNEST